MSAFADFNMQTYATGLSAQRPAYPMTFEGWAECAEQRLSEEMWSYVAGGAGNEHTQRANVRAFERWGLMPRMLAGNVHRDLSIRLLGLDLPSPLMLAPVGVIGLCDPDGHGDLQTARAAAATGVPMIGSTLTEDPMEDVAAACGDTPAWFQLYPPNDRELTESLVQRAEKSGYRAVVVTLDTLTLGWRPRDLNLASFPQLKGLCLANYFSDPVFRSRLSAAPEDDLAAATMQWAALFGNQSLSWDDLPWLRSLTDLPLLLKGICHPDDARRALDAGVDGIYCSTHGGRQANGGLPALEALPGVVDAADGAPVVFDSGIRTGADVVKALALGASAVAIGRPYAYGIAMGGSAGAEHVLRCLLAETELTMAINGYVDVASLTRDALVDLR